MSSRSSSRRPRLLVVGGGFAGLWATRALKSAAIDIVLLDRTNHHLFQPLLYQVATAGLTAPAIAAPLRHILKSQQNVTTLLADVRQIDLPQQRLGYCAPGASSDTALTHIEFDYLLLASGATHAYFGQDAWAAFAPGLKTLDDALAIRRKVLEAFEAAERSEDPQHTQALLTFAIIGGGPTGVELAGTLAEIARHTLRREFRRIDPRQARVVLVEAGPRILSSFDPKLSLKARKQLEKLGVEVWTERPVTAINHEGLTAGGQLLGARTVLWAAGVAASPLGRQLGVPLDRAGRVLVDADLSVPGYASAFVAGDLAALSVKGRQLPGIAPTAKQMGRHVANSIRRSLNGRPSTPFVYRDYGALATIGRHAAVVDIKGWRFSGFFAWWFWLAAHIFFLIGFRNRLMVLTDWAWAYLSHQRWARIIVGRPADGP